MYKDKQIFKKREISDHEQPENDENKNDRYNDNSYTTNGYSFCTNTNLLNMSMSPIHKIGSQCAIPRDEKSQNEVKTQVSLFMLYCVNIATE